MREKEGERWKGEDAAIDHTDGSAPSKNIHKTQ